MLAPPLLQNRMKNFGHGPVNLKEIDFICRLRLIIDFIDSFRNGSTRDGSQHHPNESRITSACKGRLGVSASKDIDD
jgi:hypothetical protein